MFSAREIERKLYRAPEVDCCDYKHFPEVEEIEFMRMKCEFSSDESKVHIFPFISHISDGCPYIDIYVWDCMLYPKCYKRFIICEGMRLNSSDEKEYLQYVKSSKSRESVSVDENDMQRLYQNVIKIYPGWHYYDYKNQSVSEAMCHLYFASHRSGTREILYKAGLHNIAYIIDFIPDYNLVGTSPTTILGLPIKLLRILNQVSLVHNLFIEDTKENCRKIYAKYSDYIGKECVSSAQWSYLEMLYFNNGMFGGTGFSRALYKKLEHEWGDEIVNEYGRFLELKNKMPGLDLRLPKPEDVEEEADRLDIVYTYKTDKVHENNLIRNRSKETYYEYSSGDFMVILPKDGVEMCMEAIDQGNCLMNYISSHAAGNITIVFVRKRNEPRKPFVTIEISGHAITQVYGKYNVLPCKEVYIFLEKYAREKVLFYDPFELISKSIENQEDVDDDLWYYFKDVEQRRQYPSFPCEDICCYQMTLQDCFPSLIEEVGTCA